MAIVKTSRAGMTAQDARNLMGESGSPMKGRVEFVGQDPQQRVVYDPSGDQKLRDWFRDLAEPGEKGALLNMKAAGRLRSDIKDTSNRFGPPKEYDFLIISMTKEESARLQQKEGAIDGYREIVISTLSDAGYVKDDGKDVKGHRQMAVWEEHTDTNNVHIGVLLHRHAVDRSDPARITASNAINISDRSIAVQHADVLNARLRDKGFDGIEDWFDKSNTSAYSDRGKNAIPDENKQNAAKELQEAGVREIPEQLKTGAPEPVERVSPEKRVEELRASTPEQTELEKRLTVLEAENAKRLAQLDREKAEALQLGVAISEARIAHAQKAEALDLRDAAIAERDAANAARDAALQEAAAREAAAAQKVEQATTAQQQAEQRAATAQEMAAEEAQKRIATEGKLETANQHIADLETEVKDLEQAKEDQRLELEGKINDLNVELSKRDNRISDLENEVAQRDKRIGELASDLSARDRTIEAQGRDIKSLKDQLGDSRKLAEAETRRANKAEGELAQSKTTIEQLTAAAKARDADIVQRDAEIARIKGENGALSKQSQALEKNLEEANRQLRDMQQQLKEAGERADSMFTRFEQNMERMQQQQQVQQQQHEQQLREMREELQAERKARQEAEGRAERLQRDMAAADRPSGGEGDVGDAGRGGQPGGGEPAAGGGTRAQRLREDMSAADRAAEDLARRNSERKDPGLDDDKKK